MFLIDNYKKYNDGTIIHKEIINKLINSSNIKNKYYTDIDKIKSIKNIKKFMEYMNDVNEVIILIIFHIFYYMDLKKEIKIN